MKLHLFKNQRCAEHFQVCRVCLLILLALGLNIIQHNVSTFAQFLGKISGHVEVKRTRKSTASTATLEPLDKGRNTTRWIQR